MNKKRSRPGVSGVVNATVLLLFSLLCIVPFYYVVVVSISDPNLVREGQFLFTPKGFSLKAYQTIFSYYTFRSSLLVSVTRTVFGTMLSLVLESSLAYALSKDYLHGHKFLTIMLIITLLFNGGMIPTYIIVRETHLLNTIWALIVPNAIVVMNVLILISFFRNIPASVEESAKIDGANDLVIFFRLAIPLSLPAIASIALFNAVSNWNALMDGVMYINSENLKPLQVFLYGIVMQTKTQDMAADAQALPTLSIQTATIFAGPLPIILVYPFLQRYFVKGITLGAVKG